MSPHIEHSRSIMDIITPTGYRTEPPGVNRIVSNHAGTVPERIGTGLVMFTCHRRAIHPLPGQSKCVLSQSERFRQ